jgi:probable F420-dependent oxidoreductase
MKVDAGLPLADLGGVPGRARQIESAGYDGAISAEISSDPFLPLALAAEHTARIDLITSIAVAFARNPMTLAQVGHDLNCYSRGRFVLGLGSQIQAHITKRFGMPWSRPAARMREFVLAMRAIWSCWYEGKALDFRGEFYRHTLMTPMFTPSDRSQGAPRVFVAAVGPVMTEAAAEVADGLIAHAFTTARYLHEVTLPAVARGLAKAGRRREDFEIMCPIFTRVAGKAERFEAQTRALRQQVAFYASTPAYRGVLELHGWGELQGELNRLSKLGRWSEMGECIGEDVLDAFCVSAEPQRLADALLARCGGAVDRVLDGFGIEDPELRAEQVAKLRAG